MKHRLHRVHFSRVVGILTTGALLLAQLINNSVVQAQSTTLAVAMTAITGEGSTTLVNVGDTITYDMFVSCSSNTVNCTAFSASFQIPVNTTLVNVFASPPFTATSTIPQWKVTKAKTDPPIDPHIGQNVYYQVQFCPTTQLGNETLTNVQILHTY